LKFRKNKPPLKIMEKGDQRPIIETPKTCPVIQKPEEKQADWLPFGTFGPILIQKPALCPLCKKPLSENNYDTVVLNGKPIVCHKTCP